MHVKRRRLLNFETCSVALFATFAFSSPMHSRAQAPTPSTPTTQASPAQSSTIPPNRWTREQLTQAFKRSDSDGDGQLSRQEASLLAGLSARFEQIDSNKDGSISSAEFDEALK